MKYKILDYAFLASAYKTHYCYHFQYKPKRQDLNHAPSVRNRLMNDSLATFTCPTKCKVSSR